MPVIVIHATRGALDKGWIDEGCPVLNQNLLACMTIKQQLRHIAKTILENPESEVVQVIVSTTELVDRLLTYTTELENKQGLSFILHLDTMVEVESFDFDFDKFLGEHNAAMGVNVVETITVTTTK